MFCVDLGLGSTCKYVCTYVLVYVCTHTQHVVRIGMRNVLKLLFNIILISVLCSLNDCLIYVDLYLNLFLYPLWCISTKYVSYQSLQRVLEETFPGISFDSTVVQPRRMLEPEVILIIPEKTQEWEIIPNRLPTAVR